MLSDDRRTVELHPIQNSSHSAGALMVYLPEEKLLFQSDLFATGAPQLRGLPVLWSSELLGAITARGLDVKRIAGGHGLRVASIEELRRALRTRAYRPRSARG